MDDLKRNLASFDERDSTCQRGLTLRGALAWYHVRLDILGYNLDKPANFDQSRDIAEETWPELVSFYRELIRKSCPPLL
ncbi:MAG: hypothetical protein ACI8W3_001180 [Myxococcota bacterium]